MREPHISLVAYFLTSVGSVPSEVVAPAGHAAHEHQNFRGIDKTKACDTTDTRQTYKLRE